MNRAPGYSEHCVQVLFLVSKELQQRTGDAEGEADAPIYLLCIYLEDKNAKSAYLTEHFSETNIAADCIS